MALFGKMFDKKACAICGGEIGLLGNKKLADGNMCKTCARKLSPWFDGRRNATVEQILAQLEAREENQRKLQSWRHDLCLGEHQKMFVRTENGVPESFVIAYSESYRDSNEDIIPFACVDSCQMDIRESRSELTRKDPNGEEISYNPPRYQYSYDFYIKLIISGIPYIEDIFFKVNRTTLKLETTRSHSGRGIRFSHAFDPIHYPEYREFQAVCDEICQVVDCAQQGIPYGTPAAARTFRTTAVPMHSDRQTAEAAVTPDPAEWICPGCGKESSGKFCSECGTAKPVSAAGDWKCFCGTVNTGKFCSECGTPRFGAADITCSACSWTAEPGTVTVPVFCPNCGRRFNADDL